MELNSDIVTTPPLDAATVMMLRDGEAGLEVFLLKRHGLSDVLGGAYVFPGGKVDAGETLEGCLARELREELGIDADDIQRLLTPISPPGAILKFDTARNLLVIGGSTQDRQAITDNIRVFDVDWMAGMSFGLFTLQSAFDVWRGRGGMWKGRAQALAGAS